MLYLGKIRKWLTFFTKHMIMKRHKYFQHFVAVNVTREAYISEGRGQGFTNTFSSFSDVA